MSERSVVYSCHFLFLLPPISRRQIAHLFEFIWKSWTDKKCWMNPQRKYLNQAILRIVCMCTINYILLCLCIVTLNLKAPQRNAVEKKNNEPRDKRVKRQNGWTLWPMAKQQQQAEHKKIVNSKHQNQNTPIDKWKQNRSRSESMSRRRKINISHTPIAKSQWESSPQPNIHAQQTKKKTTAVAVDCVTKIEKHSPPPSLLRHTHKKPLHTYSIYRTFIFISSCTICRTCNVCHIPQFPYECVCQNKLVIFVNCMA